MNAFTTRTSVVVFPNEARASRHALADTGDVDVWHARLDSFEPLRPFLTSALSAGEQNRAAGYRFDRERRRYETGRALLRSILSLYLGTAPGSIAMIYENNGKPRLQGEQIAFNVSHSEDLFLLALARSGSIGVDVEAIRPMPNADGLVSRFFSENEQKAYANLAESERIRGFFTGWTRKEAYIKALGAGLSASLEGFDVSVEPGTEPRLLRVEGAPDEPDRWSFASLPVDDGFLGVVAIDHPIRSVHLRKLHPA